MPSRGGARPVDHAITQFQHVRIARSALLGGLDKPSDERQNFFDCISRVGVGAIAVSVIAIPALSLATHVAARYSFRRTVTSPYGTQVPIWSFRTQQIPILQALARFFVMKAYALEVTTLFSEQTNKPGSDPRVRAGIAAALKACVMQQCQASVLALTERCGAQGLFEENQLISLQV